MRTLLHDASSGTYFKALDQWTPDPDEAHDFGVVTRAARFACKAGFTEMELVLSFDNSDGCPELPMENIRLPE